MTPEQREAAAERMARDLYERDSGLPVARKWPSWSSLLAADSPVPGQYRVKARSALDALLSEFVVLHRDDVNTEVLDIPFSEPERRWVTRWEPIEEEDQS